MPVTTQKVQNVLRKAGFVSAHSTKGEKHPCGFAVDRWEDGALRVYYHHNREYGCTTEVRRQYALDYHEALKAAGLDSALNITATILKVEG